MAGRSKDPAWSIQCLVWRNRELGRWVSNPESALKGAEAKRAHAAQLIKEAEYIEAGVVGARDEIDRNDEQIQVLRKQLVLQDSTVINASDMEKVKALADKLASLGITGDLLAKHFAGGV